MTGSRAARRARRGAQATFLRGPAGGAAPGGALAAELDALPQEALETRCRRSGVSRRGGRADLVRAASRSGVRASGRVGMRVRADAPARRVGIGFWVWYACPHRRQAHVYYTLTLARGPTGAPRAQVARLLALQAYLSGDKAEPPPPQASAADAGLAAQARPWSAPSSGLAGDRGQLDRSGCRTKARGRLTGHVLLGRAGGPAASVLALPRRSAHASDWPWGGCTRAPQGQRPAALGS